MLDLTFVRSHFPALQTDFAFMDNAGGAHVPQSVIDRISQYLSTCNVQLGADYEVSTTAGKQLKSVTENLATFINARQTEEVVIGPSTTLLLRLLSICLSKQWQAGDEVIVTNSDHEANVSCWMDLKAQGINVKIWKINPSSLTFELDDLRSLLSSKTRLVAMVHASNILGTINPIQQVAQVVHEAGALLCVDGVAYAPHRAIDVQAWDVDYYVFSTYKVFGPHQAILYGRYALLSELDSINHYFIGKDAVPYKLQPGNFNFELTYGMQGTLDYFEALGKHHQLTSASAELSTPSKPAGLSMPSKPAGLSTPPKPAGLASLYDLIADHEAALAETLLAYLRTLPKIKIIGSPGSDPRHRVPTISFVHEDFKSSDIVQRVDPHRIGIRYGDFYAKKLIHDLDLETKDGVVRVSLVHYNTIEEVQRLIEVLRGLF